MRSYTRFKGFVVAFVWVAASVSAAASTLFLDDYSQNTIDNYTQLWKTASNKGVFTHNAAQSTLDYNRTNSAVSAWHTDFLLLKETTFSIANLNRFVVRAQITFSNEISTAQAGIVIAASPDTPAGAPSPSTKLTNEFATRRRNALRPARTHRLMSQTYGGQAKTSAGCPFTDTAARSCTPASRSRTRAPAGIRGRSNPVSYTTVPE